MASDIGRGAVREPALVSQRQHHTPCRRSGPAGERDVLDGKPVAGATRRAKRKLPCDLPWNGPKQGP